MNKQTLVTVGGNVLGAAGGFVYYKLFPCEGGCTVTSSPYITMLMGAFIGGFVTQLVYQIVYNSKS